MTPAKNNDLWTKCKAGFQFCKEKITNSKSKIWQFALLFIAFFAIELLAFIMLLPSVGFCLLFGLFWSILFAAILLMMRFTNLSAVAVAMVDLVLYGGLLLVNLLYSLVFL